MSGPRPVRAPRGATQPLAVTMNGGAVLCVDVDPSHIERRIATRYLDEFAPSLDEAVEKVLAAEVERRCRWGSKATPPRCSPNCSGAASRSTFAYIDAWKIRERRLDAIDAGLAPQIEGMQSSVTYWNQWNEEWGLVLRGGVLIAAVGLYTDEDSGVIEADPAVRAAVPIPSRRTDILSLSYPGELLVDSNAFPQGYLDPTPPIDC